MVVARSDGFFRLFGGGVDAGAVVDAHGDADTHLVRRLGEKLVEPAGVAATDGSGDVLWGVAQVDGVDFGVAFSAEQTGTQGQDATAVCSGAFGEDADDALGVGFDERRESDELGFVMGDDGRWREGEEDGAQEGNALDSAAVRVGARKDGLEDAGEVQRVERRCEGGGDDCAGLRELVLGL